MTEIMEVSQVYLHGILVDPGVSKLLPESVARQHHVAPLRFEHRELVVAVTNAFQRALLREIAAACRYPVRPVQATFSEIRELIDYLYGSQAPSLQPLSIPQALFALGYLNEQVKEEAENWQSGVDEPFSVAFSRAGIATEDGVLEATGLVRNLPHIRPDHVQPSLELAPLLSWETVQELRVIPLWWVRGLLVVGIPEDHPLRGLDELERLIGVPFLPALCTRRSWEQAARQLYLRGRDPEEEVQLSAARWLLGRGELSPLHFETSQSLCKQTRRSPASILVEGGIVSPGRWAEAISRITKIPIERNGDKLGEINGELCRLIPTEMARRFGALPLHQEGETLILGMGCPAPHLVKLFERVIGMPLQVRILELPVLASQLERCFGTFEPTSIPVKPRLGEFLLGMDLVTSEQLRLALEQSTRRSILLGEQLVRNGHLSEIELMEALALQHNLAYAGLEYARFSAEEFTGIPSGLLVEHAMLPLVSNSSQIWVAVDDPLDGKGLADIEAASAKRAWPILAPTSVLRAALERLTGGRLPREPDPAAESFLEKLIQAGCLTQVGAARALGDFIRHGGGLDEAILQASDLPPMNLVQSMATILEVQFLDLRLREETVRMVDPLGRMVERTVTRDPMELRAARLVDYATAKRLGALPVGFMDDQVVVAFADPLFESAASEMCRILGQAVKPALAVRQDLEEAIQRALGRQNLGSALLLAGVITRRQLNDALDYARRTGVRLGRALMDRGYVSSEQLAQFLARQAGMTFTRLPDVEVDGQVANQVDPFLARKYGVLPIQSDGKQVTVAIIDPLDREALSWAQETLKLPLVPVLVSERG